jgi:tryptophan halogenase
LSDAGRSVTLDRPIGRVVVAGGGLAGWSAAAALKRRIPLLEIEIIGGPPPADSIVDRVIGTLPSIMDFHSDIGLTEADTVVRAQSGLRAGTLFEGWTNDHPPYVHAYGNYGQTIEATPFHQQWLRAREASMVEPFDRFSPAAELGRAARLAGATAGKAGIAPQIGYGLHLTLERYLQLMRAYALHLGVAERPGEIGSVQLSDNAFVEALLLTDGVAMRADLFVDCTGPMAKIRSHVRRDFIEWGRWLPCDRLLFATDQPDAHDQLLDTVTAMTWGWQWRASSPSASSIGAAYSSSHAARDEVIDALAVAPLSGVTEVPLRQGRWEQPWAGNCVPIGDSAVSIEPLEWANLHLVHSHVDRLASMMCGSDCSPVELAEYNRQCAAEADRIRDFLCLHYVASRRNEPFWMDASSTEPPASLAHTLSLFAERGRLPYYEEETFTRDSWLAVLLGQGIEPRRTDPLADIVPAGEAARSIAKYRDAVKNFVESQPDYQQSLSSLGQHA